MAFGCALGGFVGNGLWPTVECGYQTVVKKEESVDYSHTTIIIIIIIIIKIARGFYQ